MMLKDTPGSMVNGIQMMGTEGYQRPWQNFAYSLATGESAFTHVMGMPFFDYLEQCPELGLPFQQQMAIYAQMTDPALVPAYDFSPVPHCLRRRRRPGRLPSSGSWKPTRICAASSTICRAWLRTMCWARSMTGRGGGRQLLRARAPADLLILKAVLHDWSDAKCAVILERCRQALPARFEIAHH
ncbi:methyltransferase [Candidatus Amarolinea dominans]|uniref:methyltransferase n=1 Tax=Candidatus Amarolinea dominans TaxID=3140696 RepID=UPI0031350899|nr:hypothetical protein [Anaerolineae bacterium]